MLEKIVLCVAIILLLIAAVNTAIVIHPQENKQRQEVIKYRNFGIITACV